METENLNFSVEDGKIFLITYGEYSGYQVVGHFRAKVEFNFREIKDKYVKDFPEEALDFSQYKFIAFLIREDLIEEVEIPVLHLSGWGEWEEVEYYPQGKKENDQ